MVLRRERCVDRGAEADIKTAEIPGCNGGNIQNEFRQLHAAKHRCEQYRGDEPELLRKPGDLVSYQINDDGTVVGNYSNEQTQVLGQIVLANFANNEGLKSEGDNVWSATQSSGVASLGTAGSG